MKYKTLFISIVMCLIGQLAYAQSRNRVHGVSTVLKKGYELIPTDKITDSTNAVFQSFSVDHAHKYYCEKSLSWFSSNIDGKYVMLINPEQIYLYTSHDNPNPNILYWVLPLQDGQYKAVIKALRHRDASLKRIQIKDSLLEMQMRQIFSAINRSITPKTLQIEFSKRIMFNHTVFISCFPDFVNDWINVEEVKEEP